MSRPRAVPLMLAALLGLAAAPAAAQPRFEAVLAGQAWLPALSIVPPPADAPRDALVSGKFTGAARNDRPGSVAGTTGPAPNGRPTGIALPFVGQPVQGFSSMKAVPNRPGHWWVTTDNGFGTRRNSSDALLMFHEVRVDARAGEVERLRTIFLRDPDRVLPFRIVHEGTEARYLTGADFDVESLVPVGDGFWFGDEFGPYLFHADNTGRVTRLVETRLDGAVIRSPDNHALQVAASPTEGVPFRVQRSGGFEGMAATPDGSRIWAMLEKPLFGADGARPQGADARALHILEFDTARGDWTGRSVRYRLEDGATAIGDINMIDERRALVIERDDAEGDPSLACREGTAPPACFHNPARHKRVFVVDLGATDADGFVRKLGQIDLLQIRDPDNLARERGDLGPDAPRDRFSFPFFTIETVAVVDADHILVGNDNNLPFSAGRRLGRADNNEFILLRVPELLRAR